MIYTYRAQCVNVVDGDTVDLLVDLGFRQFARTRFRLARIDTPELSSKDPEARKLAQEARDFVVGAIKQPQGEVSWQAWTLRIETKKDPDNYGRWLCEIFYRKPDSTSETNLNQELLDLGLAALYKG